METIKPKIKNINIEIPKADYLLIPMSIKEDGQSVELEQDDLIFLTISSFPNSKDYKIQKSLNNGITYNQETKKYEIEFYSEDTEKLTYKVSYGYDITIYYGGEKPKQKVIGKFTVTDKFTLNEVV